MVWVPRRAAEEGMFPVSVTIRSSLKSLRIMFWSSRQHLLKARKEVIANSSSYVQEGFLAQVLAVRGVVHVGECVPCVGGVSGCRRYHF